MATEYKGPTFLSSEMGKKGSFLAVAAAAVGDKEVKWRRFLSGSPMLPIDNTRPQTLDPPRTAPLTLLSSKVSLKPPQGAKTTPKTIKTIFVTHPDYPISQKP